MLKGLDEDNRSPGIGDDQFLFGYFFGLDFAPAPFDTRQAVYPTWCRGIVSKGEHLS